METQTETKTEKETFRPSPDKSRSCLTTEEGLRKKKAGQAIASLGRDGGCGMKIEPSLAPILVYDGEHISLSEAADYAERHPDTIRRWCKLYLIARPAQGTTPLKIHKPALAMIMHGDLVAVELLRSGLYAHERVARYYDFAGIPYLPGSDSPR